MHASSRQCRVLKHKKQAVSAQLQRETQVLALAAHVGSPFERPRDPRVEGADLCRVEAGGKGRGHLADGDAAQLPRARLGHVERVLVVGRDAPPQLQQQPVTQQIGRALVPHHHDVPVVRHQRRPSTLVRMRNVEAPHLGAERALQKARDTVVRRATANSREERQQRACTRRRASGVHCPSSAARAQPLVGVLAKMRRKNVRCAAG
eukprot:6201925-Pleurochrysis_carterae.AAC.5